MTLIGELAIIRKSFLAEMRVNTEPSALAELGRRLAARRTEAALSMEALAKVADIDPASVARFEGGEGGLSAVKLAKIAERLGLPAITFLHTKAPTTPAAKDPDVMLRAARVAVLHDKDYDALAAGLRRARVFHELGVLLGAPDFSAGFKPSVAPEKNAHQAGYSAAREARALLVAREDRQLPSVARVIEDDFNTLVIRHDFSDKRVLGASCRSGAARVIAVSKSVRPLSLRFVLAHELAHQLLDLGPEGSVEAHDWDIGAGFGMENPPGEKRANAFAAMFLAPESAVARVLGVARPEGYGLDDARRLTNTGRHAFGLRFDAMAWHLHNLRYIKSDETARALISAPEADAQPDAEEESKFDGLERRTLAAFNDEKITGSRAREIIGRSVESLLER